VARVALDADIVIAFLDPGDDQHTRAVTELRPLLAAGDELLVGATVYAETIVRPLQEGTDATVDAFLDAAGVKIVPVDRAIARRAAQLRAEHSSLRLPDAMSLATALATDATLLTLDKKLQQVAKRAQRRSKTQ
jgi:predicted nucleic acid-binding protein